MQLECLDTVKLKPKCTAGHKAVTISYLCCYGECSSNLVMQLECLDTVKLKPKCTAGQKAVTISYLCLQLMSTHKNLKSVGSIVITL